MSGGGKYNKTYNSIDFEGVYLRCSAVLGSQILRLYALVAAWAVIVIVSWIDVENMVARVSQTVVQTAWFIYIVAVIHSIR